MTVFFFEGVGNEDSDLRDSKLIVWETRSETKEISSEQHLCGPKVLDARGQGDDRKAAVTQIDSPSNQGMQKSISLNLQVDGLQQKSAVGTADEWSEATIELSKLDNRRLDKRSLVCALISAVTFGW